MKGKTISFFIMFVLLAFIINNTSAQVTGESISGEASKSVGMNISVIASPPILIIDKPRNGTYFENTSLRLNLTSNGLILWYNLDNGDNITISGTEFTAKSLLFNASSTGHTIYIFTNNSDGNLTTKNVTFSIDLNRYNVTDNNFTGSTKGNSINFNEYTYEELGNISGIILENINHGKISLNSVINLTNDETTNDNITDIDEHVNISSNRIEINATGLPNFNTSTTLILYNLSFTTPRILRDGAVCASSICTQNSYSSDGNLSFNVTGFSVYSAEETPDEDDIQPAPPSGGGGTTPAPKAFTVDKELIKVSSKIGETFKISIKITNPSTKVINFNLNSNLEEFISFSEKEFTLNPNGIKEIFLIFATTEDSIPGVYGGKLNIIGNNEKREIPIIFEVESEIVLFDVSLDIPPNYREVYEGEIVKFQITIFNIGEIKGESEVFVEYMIKDFEGETMIHEEEIIFMEKQASFSKLIQLPEKMKPGSYIAIVQIKYGNSIGTSSEIIHVIVKRPFKELNIILIILIIIILLIIIIKQITSRNKKLKKHKGKNKMLMQVDLWRKEGYKTINTKK